MPIAQELCHTIASSSVGRPAARPILSLRPPRSSPLTRRARGSVQSGFNEVAPVHAPLSCRATSQKPPDSRSEPGEAAAPHEILGPLRVRGIKRALCQGWHSAIPGLIFRKHIGSKRTETGGNSRNVGESWFSLKQLDRNAQLTWGNKRKHPLVR